MGDSSISERIEARDFHDPAVRAYFDKLSIETVEYRLGTPRIVTIYAEGAGYWQQGDGRPVLADEDPAVMQAIGRCAASRVRGLPVGDYGTGIHPRRCGWCQYPMDELLAACDWATWTSRYLVSEIYVWSGRDAWITYERAGRDSEYENPAWRDFWELPRLDRITRVERAMAA